MEYKRILLGTDGSEAMEPVYEHCTYLACLTHATVDIVYILDIDGVQPELAVMEADTENVYNDLLAAGEKIVENAKRALLSRGVDAKAITVAVLEGNPWDEIHTYVKRQAIDLVVIGKHRRKGVSRFHLGSVADRVIRGTEVPVLVVRAG
ncbi:MAG TPA: universal stress protein [Candidatus Bathyarchaeia archaeon]|nr:universal stress protein [Candidatus Bathyarchaeia archaeon]